MALIRYENYRYTVRDGEFLQLYSNDDGGGDGGGGGAVDVGNVIRTVDIGGGGSVVNVGINGPTAITQPATPSGYFDQQIVGLPATIPASVIQSAQAVSDTIVITPQVLVEGFGSYLEDILPHEIAVTAGAFGASMQQIKNITQIPVEKFAQVVASMETIQGLDLVNGTNVPTDIEEAQIAYELIALGTGPYKTFTYSDFFGCMSGLPYAWQQLQTLLTDLQTNNLTSIYKQLYLAVSWNRATATIQYTDDGFGTYTTTGVTLTNPGGGYGREGAVAPVVTVNGATVTATIGTDDNNMTTFGKVTGLNFTPGTTGSVPTISIDYPPGGSSYPNSVVQGYIDAANTEIALIRTVRPGASVDLNDLYNKFGTQLQNEQLVRNTGLSPLPNVIDPAEPRDAYINKYPIAIYSFVDSLPLYGKQTQPHMAAQTLEAISDLTFGAGQSIIAAMRKARNQDRLNYIGVSLDDNIPDFIVEQKEWITNTTLTSNVYGPNGNIFGFGPGPNGTVVSPSGNIIGPNGTVIGVANNIAVTTLVGNAVPAYPTSIDPLGYYDPVTQTYNVYTTPVSINIIPNIDPTFPPGGGGGTGGGGGGGGTGGVPGGGVVPGGNPIGGLVSVTITNPNPSAPNSNPDPANPNVNLGPGTGTKLVPAGTGRPARPVDTGGPKVPGSLAKSPYQNLIPPQLNTLFTSDVLFPAQYSVPDAIEQVITCNCDCWI